MRGWLCALPTLLAACGSDAAKPDAPIDVPGARCDPTAAFGPPVLVTGINSDLDEACARFSEDELEVTFARRTGTAWDL
ncbi:MAG: hypothetical protein ABI175_28210 [Polyangiales bacterium]